MKDRTLLWGQGPVIENFLVLVRTRRTNRDNGFEQDDMSLGFTQDVDCLTRVVSVLLLLDSDHTQDGVGVLVVKRKVRNPVMLK